MIALMWHLWRHGHSVRVNRTMSTLPGDIDSKGWLYVCECGRTEAR